MPLLDILTFRGVVLVAILVFGALAPPLRVAKSTCSSGSAKSFPQSKCSRYFLIR